MNIEYLIVNEADRDQIISLYRQAGWWTASDNEDVSFVDKIISSTFKFAVAKAEGRIIGMGRAISDGVSDAYIQDVTVDQKYRKRGIGSGIIRLLVQSLKAEKIGWIGLISEPGAENFYNELGFGVMKDHTPYIFKEDKNCD